MIELMISSSVLVLLICFMRILLRGRISPHLQYGIWGLAVLRLMLPFNYPLNQILEAWKSRISVMNAAEAVRSKMIAGTPLEPLADNLAKGWVYHFDSADGAVSVAQKAAGIDWQLWIMVFWVLGSLSLIFWTCRVNLRLSRYLHRNRRRYRGVLPEFVTKPVYVVEGLSSPCYVGMGQGEAFYLPDFIEKDEGKVRHALAHEAGHVIHHDRLWGILRCGLLCYFWINPFIWIAAVLSRRDGEIACDETAVKLLGEEERYKYGKTLVDIVAEKGQGQALFFVSTTMSANKKTIQERIQSLVKRPRMTAAAWIAAMAGIALMTACTFSGAEPPADAASSNQSASNQAAPNQEGREAECLYLRFSDRNNPVRVSAIPQTAAGVMDSRRIRADVVVVTTGTA